MLGLWHLHQRRKKLAGKSPTAKSAVNGAVLDLLIYCAAIAAPLALVPQAVQLYASHDAASLSLATWSILGLLNLLWLVYGYVHKERPIIIANVLAMLFNFAIAFGILLYS